MVNSKTSKQTIFSINTIEEPNPVATAKQVDDWYSCNGKNKKTETKVTILVAIVRAYSQLTECNIVSRGKKRKN